MADSPETAPYLSTMSIRFPSTHAYQVVASMGLVGMALIHLLDTPSKFSETPYQGVGFVALIIASLVLADLLLRSDSPLVWGLAAIVAGLTILGFVISRTAGLPQAPADDIGNWGEPLGLASLFVEGTVVWLAIQRLRLGATIPTADRSTSAAAR